MSTFNDRDSLMIESGIDPDSYVSSIFDNSDFSFADCMFEFPDNDTLLSFSLYQYYKFHYDDDFGYILDFQQFFFLIRRLLRSQNPKVFIRSHRSLCIFKNDFCRHIPYSEWFLAYQNLKGLK